MKQVRLAVLMVAVFACRQERPLTRFYRDIDMFTLEGKGELSPDEIKYPYIRIDSLGPEQKKVSYFYDEKDNRSIIYTKNWLGWVFTHDIDDPIFYTIKYEIVPGNGTIINLEYIKNSYPTDTVFLKVSDSTILTSVSFLTSSTLNSYRLPWPRKIHLKPTIDTSAYPIDKAIVVDRQRYSISDGKLNVVWDVKRYWRGDQSEDNDRGISCRAVGTFSYAWYRQFRHRMDSCSR